MKEIVVVFAVLCCLGCKQKKINCFRPYSIREIALMDSVKDEGQTITIHRFNYPYSGDSLTDCVYDITSLYIIGMKNVDSTYMNNQDSMRVLTKRLVSKLYNHVIEDSIMIYTEAISLNFIGKKDKPKRKPKLDIVCDYSYSVRVKRKDLENFFGFKVVQTKSGFSRKSVNQKSDSLVLTNESYSRCK